MNRLQELAAARDAAEELGDEALIAETEIALLDEHARLCAGPDFNVEANLHADTVAERFDAAIEE